MNERHVAAWRMNTTVGREKRPLTPRSILRKKTDNPRSPSPTFTTLLRSEKPPPICAQPFIRRTESTVPTHCRLPRTKLWLNQVNLQSELSQNIDIAYLPTKEGIWRHQWWSIATIETAA
jgi:hypothetical protein